MAEPTPNPNPNPNPNPTPPQAPILGPASGSTPTGTGGSEGPLD